MSDSTTNLDQVSQSVSQREVQINELFDAHSPASLFGRRASTCAGLVFGYYGGRLNGTSVANGTVTATASNTNYVVVHRTTLVVSIATSTTNWNNTATYGRAYKLTAGASSITAYEDHRAAIDSTGISGPVVPAASAAPLEVFTQSFSGTMTVDLTTHTAANVVIDITATSNFTLGFSNGTDGQNIHVRAKNSGGSYTFTGGTNVRFSTDITAVDLSAVADTKTSYLTFKWHAAAGKADVMSFNRGF